MTVTRFVDIVVTSMEYEGNIDSGWNAKGHVVFKDTGKQLNWEASHKGNLIVKLGEGWSMYPERVHQEIRDCIKSTLGYVNVPYSKTITLKL